VGRLWRFAYQRACLKWANAPVRTRLYGQPAVINFANPYPLYAREFPNYNAPQVELVFRTSEALSRPVAVADVGAAVGDTALLLQERCGELISVLHCIEGDEEFCSLLRANLQGPMVNIYQAMLSDSVGEIPQLTRADHQGTATATGAVTVPATTLDELLAAAEVDVLKIDTDGFDGRILGGASRILQAQRPSVLFEWHPPACRRAGTSDAEAFDHLKAAGYTRFLFFDKYGDFSHFGEEHVAELRELCLSSSHLIDWHFDVAALPHGSKVDDIALADLRFWEGRC
jgi:FkbM family methyltransferase